MLVGQQAVEVNAMTRIYESSINDLRQEYKELTGKEFNPDDYPSPEGLSGPIRKVVCELKRFLCWQLMMEINFQVQSFEKQGNFHVVPPDQMRLIEEFDALKKEAYKWV